MKYQRSPSAYNLFVKSESAKLKNSNAALKFADIARQISINWKSLSDSAKHVLVHNNYYENFNFLSCIKIKFTVYIEFISIILNIFAYLISFLFIGLR